MAFHVTVPSHFIPCPPLDFPLRLNDTIGAFGAPRSSPHSFDHTCCSDHFASVHPNGDPGIHQIHEGIDLASTAGACVYAIAGGVVSSVRPHDLTITHPGLREGMASRYVHVTPLVRPGTPVAAGQPVATVEPNAAAGDHLHLGLWHWVDTSVAAEPGVRTTIPIDLTRQLAHWERAHDMDWATIGTLDDAVAPILDSGTPSAPLATAFDVAGLPVPVSPSIDVLAETCAWRLTDGDTSYLLRHERGAITVFDEAYGTRSVVVPEFASVGVVTRHPHRVLRIEAADVVYGIPLHGLDGDHLHGAGTPEAVLADLLRDARRDQAPVELQLRRSPFWRMDGSHDEYQAVVDGAIVG